MARKKVETLVMRKTFNEVINYFYFYYGFVATTTEGKRGGFLTVVNVFVVWESSMSKDNCGNGNCGADSPVVILVSVVEDRFSSMTSLQTILTF